MKVVLLDDEQLAVEVLEILLRRVEGIEIVGMYTDPQMAHEEIKELEVDVIFLDMEMGEIHGLQFAERLMETHPQIDVVFVTAYPQFAQGAFEVNAIDYLLKPVNSERLAKTIGKLRERRRVYENPESESISDEILLFARTMGSFYLLDQKKHEVKWRTRKVRELFIYLWHNSPNPVHRSRIIEDLWPEHPEDRAITLMHTTLYQLRKIIKEIGYEKPVKLVNEQYTLNMHVESDFSELESIMQSPEITRTTIENAVELYNGDYLEEENYQWALAAQQRLKGSFLSYLESYLLIEIEDEEQSYFVEICLEKMIELEPYNERFVYLLVDYYGKTKSLQKMVATVEKFKSIWVEELGIDIPDKVMKVYNEHMVYL